MSGGPTSGTDLTVQQLSGLCGHPVRLTILDPLSNERISRISGLLVQVENARIAVDCLSHVPGLPESAPVTLEVLHQGLLHVGKSALCPRQDGWQRLYLEVPEALQTVHRRQHPRVDLAIPVHVVVNIGTQVLSAVLRDISAGGASLQVGQMLPAAQRVALVFELGSGLFFEDMEAETVRSVATTDGQYIVAVRFFCQADQEAALAAWVSRQLEG